MYSAKALCARAILRINSYFSLLYKVTKHVCLWYIFQSHYLFVSNSTSLDFHKLWCVAGLVFNSCLFLPSLAPHNAPTNNAVTTGLVDGAVVSGIGTGEYSSMTANKVFYSSLRLIGWP